MILGDEATEIEGEGEGAGEGGRETERVNMADERMEGNVEVEARDGVGDVGYCVRERWEEKGARGGYW